MNLESIKPHETYEGLKTQFFALKRILHCKEAELSVYHKRISEFKMERIIELEAELESQKEMNDILTKEIEFSNQELSKLRQGAVSDSVCDNIWCEDGKVNVYGNEWIDCQICVDKKSNS